MRTGTINHWGLLLPSDCNHLFLVPLRKIAGFSSYQAISGALDSYEHEGFQGGQIANAVWKSHEILTIAQSQDLKILDVQLMMTPLL